MRSHGDKMKGKLHHIEIYVSDLEASCIFWDWLLKSLGYSLHQDWEAGRSWKLDDTYIVFVQVTEKHKAFNYNRCRVGLNHLAFHVGTQEDLDVLGNELKARGVAFLYEDKYPQAGGGALFCEDPNRIKVELVATGNRN